MSFVHSAQDVRLDDGHTLRAKLQNGNGDWVDAEFDLNQVVGNYGGKFAWGGDNFSGSAENIQFSMEQDNSVAILRASLDNGQGGRTDATLNLGENFGNNDGKFQYNG